MARNDEETLELSEFIREALVEIVQGVEKARADIEDLETNAEICPTGLRFEKGHSPGPFKSGRGFVQEVEFDVAITVSRGRAGGGTGKASLNIGVPALKWLAGAEAEGDLTLEGKQERSQVNRITFKVPLLLPSEVYLWDEETKEQIG